MKAYFTFAILCAARAMSIAQGSNQRRLRPNPVVNFITSTEIFSASKALMISREDPTDASRTAPCKSPSAEWLRQQVSNVSDEDLSNFFDWHVYTLPFAYKLFVEKDQYDQEYFGINGEYTQEINYIHEQAQEFWSDSGVDDKIRVLSAHGSDLADMHDKLIPTLEVLFSGSYDDEYTVFDHATDIQELITRLPGGYNYPLLTFNAFATDEGNKHDFPSIIIGDGYFDFLRSMGLGSEGPEYALTHEHAHHLQFSLGVKDSDSSQNARRQELMADAFSAYFLTHISGGDMTGEEISNIHSVAYSVGDCEISNDARHHGTPQQRRCATIWGASVASSQDAANIDLIELKNRFDTWYERDLDDFCEHSNSAAPFTSYHIICSLQVFAALFGSANMFGF